MSTINTVPTQNSTHFYLTQEIWNQAWHSKESSSIISVCAKIACIVFPILLTVAVVEAVVWAVRSVIKISSDPKSAPLDPQSVRQALSEVNQTPRQQEQQQTSLSVDKLEADDTPVNKTSGPQQVQKIGEGATGKNPNIITVTLPPGSSLSDITGNLSDPDNIRPPASTYHALAFARYAYLAFDTHKDRIEEQRIDALVQEQRRMIEFGTGDYFRAIEKDPSMKDAADLNAIRLKDPEYLPSRKLYFEPTNQEPLTVVERIPAIVEHLFIPQEKGVWPVSRPKMQIALIEWGFIQAIAVVCADDRVICFNSNKNEITMTVGKEATQAYLTETLELHPYFTFALGQYDRTRESEKPPEIAPLEQQETVEPGRIEPSVTVPAKQQETVEPGRVEPSVTVLTKQQETVESERVEPSVTVPTKQQETVEPE